MVATMIRSSQERCLALICAGSVSITAAAAAGSNMRSSSGKRLRAMAGGAGLSVSGGITGISARQQQRREEPKHKADWKSALRYYRPLAHVIRV